MTSFNGYLPKCIRKSKYTIEAYERLVPLLGHRIEPKKDDIKLIVINGLFAIFSSFIDQS